MDNEEEFFKSETVSKAAETDYQMERLMNNIKDVKNFKDFADFVRKRYKAYYEAGRPSVCSGLGGCKFTLAKKFLKK